MLGKYITINSEKMPNPVSFEGPGPKPSENIFESEAGVRLTQVRRLDRPSWTATFQCTSSMRDKILGYCKMASVVTIVDGVTMEGTLRTSGLPQLVKNSEYCIGTSGLWSVSVVFEGE